MNILNHFINVFPYGKAIIHECHSKSFREFKERLTFLEDKLILTVVYWIWIISKAGNLLIVDLPESIKQYDLIT